MTSKRRSLINLLSLSYLFYLFGKLCYNVIKKPTILLEISKIVRLSRRTTETLDVKSQLNI